MKTNIFDKYNDIPELAKWKAIILDFGVNLEDKLVFNRYPNIYLFKTKYAIKKPTVENFIFFDSSKENTLIPSEIIIEKKGKSSLLKLNYRENSPLVITTLGKDIVLIEKNSRKIIDLKIKLVKKRKYSLKRLPSYINKEKPLLEEFISFLGIDRIGILATEGCWHWNTGKACLFCDSNPKRQDEKTFTPSLNTLKEFKFNLSSWWNYYKKQYLSSIKYCFNYINKKEKISPHKHLLIMSGNTPDISKAWDICFEIINVLNDINPISNYDNYLCLGVPRKNQIEYLLKAKNLGVKSVQFNLEIYGEGNFIKVCPGKAQFSGYKNIVNSLKLATEIFGKGNARTNFVLGAQPIDELLEGIQELAEKGIVSDYSVFIPKKGTPWERKPSPSMDEVVYFSKKLAYIYKKYNFKPIYCSLSSRTSIINEIFYC